MAKHVKPLLLTMAVSISVFTVLSVLAYLFRRNWYFGTYFNLLTPFGINGYAPRRQLVFAVLIYCMVGFFSYTTFLLFKKGKLGLKLVTLFHFLTSTLIFSLLGILQCYAPRGGGVDFFSPFLQPFYFLFGGHVYNVILWFYFILPVSVSVILYIICYAGIWFYYRFEIKIINKKINEFKK
jgi:hypothetical protein